MKKDIFVVNSKKGILGDFDARDLLLINVLYQRKTKDRPDVCTVIYKDTATGKKHKLEIVNPLMKMYVVKEPYRDSSYYPESVPREHCDTWTFPAYQVFKHIEKLAGNEVKRFIQWCMDTQNYRALGQLHHCPYVLGSDFPYENHFRIQWLLDYADPNVNKKITKSYMDIEVDGIDVAGVPKDGESPINAVTMVDEESRSVYTFLLRNQRNPQIEQFEKDVYDFEKELHLAFDESYGEMDYRFYMYDEELELIRDVFRLIHTLKRDFLLFWNGFGYDIPYFIKRIVALGENPEDIMCDPSFEYKMCYFKKDLHHFDHKLKKDWLYLTSYTVIMDQMLNYAKVRKGEAELHSVKLNAIGKKEIGDTKLDYSEEANIKTLPYVDYKKFVMYNIKDVLLQYGIERRTQDLETIFERAYDNATDYNSIFSQTIFLKDRIFLDYYREMDLISGNNVNMKYGIGEDNKDEKDEDERFEGALVGDPLNNTHEGVKIYGKKSKFVFEYVIDFDFTSLYPSIIIAFNIGKAPLVFKVFMKKKYKELNEDISNTRYDPAKEMFEDLTTDNYNYAGKKWFNLPTTMDMMKDLEEFMKNEV